MKKKILACDLDNTLIYSYKHRVADDVCVEWLDGREQSFMTAQTLALWPALQDKVQLVPVTTRSVAQYRRLVWPQAGRPRLAVTTNGGILLRDDKPDAAWCDHSRKLAVDYCGTFAELADCLAATPAYAKHRLVDDLYLYVVCQDVAEAERCLADFAGFAGLEVRRGGRKVYFLPPQINKGDAVERLRALQPDTEIIAAGDSELDVPMLDAADIALLPDAGLAALVRNPRKFICPPGEHFAEFVLATSLRLAE